MSDKEISALRLTPPETTHSPILQIISCTSNVLNFSPCFLNIISLTKFNRHFSGSGPALFPPIVLRRAPAGRNLDKSNDISLPENQLFIPKTSASAQPSLLSGTIKVSNFSPVCLTTVGKNSTFFLSTENPTPVPHIRIYKISPKS